MRTLLFLAALAASSLAPIRAQHSETLVFVDKSESVSYTKDPAVKARTEALNKQLVTDRYRDLGDKVTVHFIHGSTGSANAVYSRSFSRRQDCEQEVSNIKIQQCLAQFNNTVKKEKRAVYDTLNAFVRLRNATGTGRLTRIHDVLEVAGRTFSGKTGRKYIYIYSDMVHECSARNLKNCPSSKSGAIQLAKKHADEVRKELSISGRLQGATVIVLTPDDPMKPNPKNQYLKYYWEEFFRQFGMSMDLNW